MNLTYSATLEFEKLFKKLAKRFRSLPDDLETAKRAAIELLHTQGIDNQSCFKLQGHENIFCDFYKVKKFACKTLKGKGVRSGIRIIYAHYSRENHVEFIEIYYKQDQTTESAELINVYLKHKKVSAST